MGLCGGGGGGDDDSTPVPLLPKPTLPDWLQELCEDSQAHGALQPDGPVVATWALVFRLNDPTIPYCARGDPRPALSAVSLQALALPAPAAPRVCPGRHR
jgi:hypothetical protein